MNKCKIKKNIQEEIQLYH